MPTETVPACAAELNALYAGLLCADLSLLGGRAVATTTVHLGILTLKEWTGRALEFWADATCRAAMVIDDTGVTTFGPAENMPTLGGQGVTPGWAGARRVEEWFDLLEAARA